MELARALVFAVLGLAFGSFLTVLVHRLPRGESVVRPRSACPVCGSQIRARDNVPLLSYLLLRGRCRVCRTRVSAEYPIVEALTSALFVGSSVAMAPIAQAAVVAPFTGVMLAAGLIDLRHRIIPNRLTYPSLPLFGAAIVILALLGEPLDAARAGLGMLAFGGGLLAVALISPRGMGMGDVKLAALIGLVLGALGWEYVWVAALAGVLLGGAGAVVALALGRGRKDTIPFGPYLAAGAVLSALLGSHLASWYTGLFV